MEIRFSGHSTYRAQYHIVWITKYRRRILNPGVRAYLLKIFAQLMRGLPGCEMRECNIREDHVHMVVIIPPRYALSEVAERIKSQTASILRKRFTWFKKICRSENIIWSPGFFVSTVGLDEKAALEYVRWQGSQDLGQTKFEFCK